jgi:GntR family transcriptional regulator
VTVAERAGRADRDGRPLWQQVLDDLERRIAAGEFADRFPTDRELTDRYEVSRHTVREAVRHLRARGLVDRHRGRGSFLSGQVQQPLGSLYSLFEAVEQQGLEQRSEVLRFDEVHDEDVARRLGRRRDARLVRLDRLRFAGDDPLALDRVWLPAAIGRVLRGVDLSRTSLYEQLHERADVRITGVDETIEPVLPDTDARELLQLEADEALLRVQRLGWSGDRPVECRTTLVRGRRFVYTSSWRAEGATANGGRFTAAP